jgi:hypothetical protein
MRHPPHGQPPGALLASATTIPQREPDVQQDALEAGQASALGSILDFDALRRAHVRREPYDMFLASRVVTEADAAAVRADYPAIRTPGYHPLSKLESRGAFARLIADLQSAELARTLTDLLGLDLTDKPRMITVRKISQASDGTIHTDSESKIMTMLVYLNETWDGSGAGCIRALNGPGDFEDYALEAPPLAGSAFGFLRSDRSWHGHLPFTGERYVVQTTFLTSEEELKRKEKRGGLQLMLKGLNPFKPG